MYNFSSLLEKRILRDANFLRVSGAGCLLVSLLALSLNRTEHGWSLDALTLISAGLSIAAVVAFLSGALIARTLRTFGNHHASDLTLNRYEGDE